MLLRVLEQFSDIIASQDTSLHLYLERLYDKARSLGLTGTTSRTPIATVRKYDEVVVVDEEKEK